MTHPDERSDLTLLRNHVDGDPDAFSELVRRHRDRLWAIALRTTGDAEDASDALQEALISALRGAERFRGDAQVTTWLHRIVVNACLDRLRRRKAKATGPLPDDDDRFTELSVPSTADEAVATSERQADVLAALRQLNEDQRAAVVLVDMEGYSVEEAADILGCAPGTVKSRCSRGRARLVPLLTHYNGNPGRPDDVEPTVPAAVRRHRPDHTAATNPSIGGSTS
ncbi:MAG: RNA polymerase sigma factor SigM [Propionibacteriales bacterium]|nr:RNA polymerase sigma factor SigM [Propionibacteriales bacterium]